MNRADDKEYESSGNIGPFGTEMPLYQLKLGDVFKFKSNLGANGLGEMVRLPDGEQKITIAPWGPKTRTTGPIAPWMFACRDSHGIDRHLSLSPQIVVHLLKRR